MSKRVEMLLGNIRPLWFFLAFGIGLLMCYVLTPAPEVVIKFPSPYNAGQVMYRDKAKTCFTYDATEVTCPRDKATIKPQPIAAD